MSGSFPTDWQYWTLLVYDVKNLSSRHLERRNCVHNWTWKVTGMGFASTESEKLAIIKVAVRRVARSRDASLRELSTYKKKPSSLKQINDTPSATIRGNRSNGKGQTYGSGSYDMDSLMSRVKACDIPYTGWAPYHLINGKTRAEQNN